MRNFDTIFILPFTMMVLNFVQSQLVLIWCTPNFSIVQYQLFWISCNVSWSEFYTIFSIVLVLTIVYDYDCPWLWLFFVQRSFDAILYFSPIYTAYNYVWRILILCFILPLTMMVLNFVQSQLVWISCKSQLVSISSNFSLSEFCTIFSIVLVLN